MIDSGAALNKLNEIITFTKGAVAWFWTI
jgi:hypothetical protein